MWPIWILLLFAAPVFRLASSVFSFIQNYRAARKTGLPIVCSPVYSRNIAWLVLSQLIGPLLVKAPFGLGSWVRYNRFMWVLEEKASPFLEKGKHFVVVSPAKLQVRQTYDAPSKQAVWLICKSDVLRRSRCHKTGLSQEKGLRALSGVL